MYEESESRNLLSSVEQEQHSAVASDETRQLAFWEIVSVITSGLMIEWAVLPFTQHARLVGLIPVLMVFAFMFLSHRVRGETLRELGWRFDNFGRAVRLLVLPTLAGGVALILLGWGFGSLRFRGLRTGMALLIPLYGIAWGLFQQYVLQAFINRRAQMVWGKGAVSVITVAVVFALLHLPNPALMAATFIGGIMWAIVYQRAPNLFALALSHAVMTWLLISTVPEGWLNSLRVGFNYFI
jgi:membrane protease YdiL (CAAX protease family)